MNRSLLRAGAAALAFLVLAGKPALADSWSNPVGGRNPKDARCVEHGQTLSDDRKAANAPWYEYEVPVLVSDDSGQQRRWIGWFYADACSQSPERLGKTWANFAVTPGTSGEVGSVKLVPVAQAMPAGVTVPDPAVGAIRVPPPTSLGDGVPVAVAQRLQVSGFVLAAGPDGKQHLLLESSQSVNGGSADAFLTWWPLAGGGSFYLHDPAGYAATHPEAGGGIMRLNLSPVNLSLADPSLLNEPVPDAKVQVQVTVANHSNHSVHTDFGWRYADEPVGRWHWAHTGDIGPWISGPIVIEAPARNGTLQIGVNYSGQQPDDETTYADNVVEVPIQTRPTDLIMTALDGPSDPVPAVDPPELNPFDVVATVKNSGPKPVTAEVRLLKTDVFAANVVVGRTVVTVPADGEVRVPFSVSSSVDGSTISLTAVVNADGAVPETRSDNNSRSITVRVKQDQQVYDPGSSGGVDDILIH